MTQPSDQVKSPLTGRPADKIKSVPAAALIAAYKHDYDIDVAPYLGDAKAIDLYRCKETELEFYHPLNRLAGPPEFYEKLYAASNADWAYQSGKWEFEVGARLLGSVDAVLDVGCGGGEFLSTLEGRVAERRGLETSAYGRNAAAAKGVSALNETVVDHAISRRDHYDAVTAFQVLEHASDPFEFLQGCIDVLKPGGVLLISVPNNDSFLRYCDLLPLNMPPHHVTLWRRPSLEAIASLFPVSMVRVETEPLQQHNIDWYLSVMSDRYVPNNKLARCAYYKLGGRKAAQKYVRENCDTIDGHTILASFVKR